MQAAELRDTQVAVLGGGVSGLNVARMLSAASVSFELFEARERLSGRVLTVDGTGTASDDGYDLGRPGSGHERSRSSALSSRN
jgi:monoamine oxidase